MPGLQLANVPPDQVGELGLVTVGDQVSRFPFAVGTRGRRALILYAAFAAAALAAGGFLYFYSTHAPS